MKPKIILRPTLVPRRPSPTGRILTEVNARSRLAMRYPRNFVVVSRISSTLGPVFVVDEDTGLVVHKNINSFAALCKVVGLTFPGEVIPEY